MPTSCKLSTSHYIPGLCGWVGGCGVCLLAAGGVVGRSMVAQLTRMVAQLWAVGSMVLQQMVLHGRHGLGSKDAAGIKTVQRSQPLRHLFNGGPSLCCLYWSEGPAVSAFIDQRARPLLHLLNREPGRCCIY